MTGGIIGIGFAVYALWGSIPAIIFGVVGAIAVFVACYHLWRSERVDKLSIITTKDHLESSLTNDIKQLKSVLWAEGLPTQVDNFI